MFIIVPDELLVRYGKWWWQYTRIQYRKKLQITSMFFPEDQLETQPLPAEKIVYVYQNANNELKPHEFRVGKKSDAFRNIQRIFNYPRLRLFNSEGAEYFEDDMLFVKNKSVLYASNGEDFDPASCFGEYEKIRKLGEGGFGQVMLARHKQTGQEFAIKIIKTEKVGSSAEIDSIFVEAQTLKSLKHQNIVKVHNCLTLKNMQVAIIMQYLPGGELLQYVRKQQKLDEETAKIFFKQIIKAMSYCHSNGLIHRDLKLENMLLVDPQRKDIKIIDFGIAGVIRSMTWDDLDTGSLGYMAPECFVRSKEYTIDGRIDVWSTGVILYAMLVGELPFKGANTDETIQAIKLGQYIIQPTVAKKLSPECLDIMERCLCVDPKNRPTMEDLQSHDWIIGKSMFRQSESQKIQEKPKMPTAEHEAEQKSKQVSRQVVAPKKLSKTSIKKSL